jgi:hypothetical protein
MRWLNPGPRNSRREGNPAHEGRLALVLAPETPQAQDHAGRQQQRGDGYQPIPCEQTEETNDDCQNQDGQSRTIKPIHGMEHGTASPGGGPTIGIGTYRAWIAVATSAPHEAQHPDVIRVHLAHVPV